MRIPLLALALCFALVSAARAQGNPAIDIGDAWARATSGANGAVYLTVTNHGTTDDRLTGASTSLAAKAELHTTLDENGVMKMRPLPDLPVKAGATVDFKPNGKHIMLFGLKHPLAAGDTFPLMLTFDKAGAVETMVKVMKTAGPASGDMPGMKR